MDDRIDLLLVDDDDDFRAAARRALERRGFGVREAAGGAAALDVVADAVPDVVVLDLKMPGIDGIETLRRMRVAHPALPVVVLTGHGSLHDALAGIRLEITDFVQKPVDLDGLGRRLRELLERGGAAGPAALREKSIRELMSDPEVYPRMLVDQPIVEAIDVLCDAFFHSSAVAGTGIRSARVYRRDGRFLGLVRFSELLRLVLPDYLESSPHSSYFTGMFLAQCKLAGQRRIDELLGEPVTVSVDAPLLEAVHLMVSHRLITLPVMAGEELVGVLTERAVILEIRRALGR